MYLVEIIRYGSEELGTQIYGVFDDFEKILPEMKAYNQFRGGKYPSIFVTEVQLNPTDLKQTSRVRYNVDR
jgi:hypothetical protein